MKPSVMNLLDDARKKMSGYAALLNYRFANLCIKAAPEALLPISVEVGADALSLEKVAKARIGQRDDQFEIFPLGADLLLPVVKGIKEAHPEFKVDLVGIDGSDEPEDQYILVTMPPMDDARHKVLTDGVSTLSDACNAHLDATLSYFTAQMAVRMAGATPEEMDEAKDQLQQLHDTAADTCQQYRDNKTQEIEEAYQRFLADREEKEGKLKAAAAAADQAQAGFQMKFTPEDE